MSTPHQRAALQGEYALRFTMHRARLRMRVIPVIGETFKIVLCAPRIFVSIFALPVHGCFLMRLVALYRPLTRPGEALTLDVPALFLGLRRRKFWSRLSMNRHYRKNQARSAISAELQ